MLAYFAELMDHVQFIFAENNELPACGFIIEEHSPIEIDGTIIDMPGKARRKVTVNTTITISDDISFVQMLGLITTLYQQMLDNSQGKPEQYKQLLHDKLNNIDNIAKNFIYAAEYLDTVKSSWPEKLGLNTTETIRFDNYIEYVINGLRRLAGGYEIAHQDSLAVKKAAAEAWLSIDQNWLDSIQNRFPEDPAKRLEFIMSQLNAKQDAWAREAADGRLPSP